MTTVTGCVDVGAVIGAGGLTVDANANAHGLRDWSHHQMQITGAEAVMVQLPVKPH